MGQIAAYIAAIAHNAAPTLHVILASVSALQDIYQQPMTVLIVSVIFAWPTTTDALTTVSQMLAIHALVTAATPLTQTRKAVLLQTDALWQMEDALTTALCCHQMSLLARV